MRRADIKIGERYLTNHRWPTYGAVVRVLDVGIHRDNGYRRSKTADGVRVEVVDFGVPNPSTWGWEVGSEHVVGTRYLVETWTDEDDANLAEARRARAELDAKVEGARALIDKLQLRADVRDNGSLYVGDVDDVLALLATVAEADELVAEADEPRRGSLADRLARERAR